jgi:hypothetical protein
MSPDRIARIARHLPAVALLFSAAVASAQAPPAAEWKVFQEFNFVTGSWSGPAQSGGRVGGRVVSFALEVDGATLGYRATTYFPVKDSLPEARSEEVAKIVYDSAKGKYVALVVFSTKAWGIYDAEVRPDGSIRFTAREMANLEAGLRSRWTLARKADGTLQEDLDLAPAGKDFSTYLSATLTKK